MNKKRVKKKLSSSFFLKLLGFFLGHCRDAALSFKDLIRSPLASLLTIFAIGIALALPATFLVLLENARSLMSHFDQEVQVSLFLKPSLPIESIESLKNKLQQQKNIKKVDYLSPEDSLKSFGASLGLNEISNILPENPLPGVLMVVPTLELNTSESLETLLSALRAEPEVDLVELDGDWLSRLSAFMKLLRELITALTVLLSLVVFMVIMNILRLKVENRRESIEIAKLVGATNAFIRRPFLYLGFWLGLLSSMIAWILVYIMILFLKEPAEQLFALYHSSLVLRGFDITSSVLLLSLGLSLGIGGAYLSLLRALRTLESEE